MTIIKTKNKLTNHLLTIIILIILLIIILINANLILALSHQSTQSTSQTTSSQTQIFQQPQQQFSQETQTFDNQYQPSRNIQTFNPSYSRNFNNVYGSYSNTGGYGTGGYGGGFGTGGYTGYTGGYGGYGTGFNYGYGIHNGRYGFNPEMCLNRQDFLVHVAPFGCSPQIVRSDLLEEQNAPVFCKLTSFQINPLLSGTRIRSLRVKGQLPKGVSGISYLPSKTAIIKNRDFVASPVNDIGYLVVVLSQQFNESVMPDFVEGNITAVIDYDSSGVFGIGRTFFYLNEMTEEQWQRDYRENSFWNGKAYARADSIESDRATISIYRDPNIKESTVTLKKGETSRDVFLGGFYCSAGMRIKLESLDAPVESALLQINDQQLWVSKGDRIIDNRCRVTDLSSYSGGGKISLSCPRDSFELAISSGKIEIEDNGIIKDLSVNEKIKENVFLAYIGKDDDFFAILVNDPYSDTKLEFLDKISNLDFSSLALEDENKIQEKVRNHYKSKLRDKTKDPDLVEVRKIRENEEAFGISAKEILLAKDETENIENPLAKEYYDKTINYYQELFELYSHEKIAEGIDPLAAEGLFKAARLSLAFGMNEKAERFFNDLINSYPESSFAEKARYERNLIFKYDRSNSKKAVEVDGINYYIDLLEFKKPSIKDASAVFLIDGEETTLSLNELKSINNVSLYLTEIKDDYISLNYDYIENEKSEKRISRKERLYLTGRDLNRRGKNQINVNDVNIRLNNINLKKQAKITILPTTYGTRTEANFQIKIGIEKRAIKLTPEKTRELMESLKNSIETLNSLNEKLGNVIKGLKAACFATSAVLTAKNLFEGYSGISMARVRIMTAVGGWNDKCEELAAQKLYTSLQQCLLDKNSEIEKDVKIYSSEIQKTNSIMKDIQNQVGIKRTDILDFEGQTDAKKVEEIFKQRFEELCKNKQDKITLPGADRQEISLKDICNFTSMSHEQRRDILTLYNVKSSGGSDVLQNYVSRELGRVTLEAKNSHDLNIARVISDELDKKYNLGVKLTTPAGDTITHGDIKIISSSDITHNIYKNFEKGDRIVRVYIPPSTTIKGEQPFKANSEVSGKEIFVKVQEVQGSAGIFSPDTANAVYTIDGVKLEPDSNATKSVFDYISLAGMNKIKEADFKAYQNKMTNPEKLRVKYFEREPYRGLPSEIPFDVEQGWYVKMNYVISGFGRPYDESGRVVNFYICNVGENGIIEFKQSGDDICRYYNGHLADLSFPGMSASESALLVQKAQRAIEEATRQYGQQKVNIAGRSFETGTSFDTGEGYCTDFMSPTDCSIMFNVCDPVICPASRCDLGGRYRVDNVIQTGIVGSLALCLPNIQEGIAVPICLTGVNAGIDGYISILNSTVACLNESLVTGRHVGICDEIKSIYLCDFFWKQATPFLDVLLERSFQVVLGQGVRGGGEYLTVANAFENTRKAVDFFKNQYAVNSLRAFHGRSTEFIGGSIEAEFCKAFISSGAVGASASIFEALIEPDSPEQYSAWFSENQLTTATVPPISHYKVYYHIFAGKDFGAFYSIYLKDITLTAGIHPTGFFAVDRGFIPRGSQIDRARDFTAPSGFKQLCININGREECGFGKVSTSYALNAITDNYAEEQAKQNIISEKQCIAGTPSLYSIFQPNIQAGVESAINPQLYSQGIIRICATENPGKQVLPTGEYDRTNSTYNRWKPVGYCDDPKIKCWLDTESVKNVIKDKGIEKEVLDEVNLNVLGETNYLLPEQSESILSEAENFINNLEITGSDTKYGIENKINNLVNKLERLANIGANNVYRARAFFSLAKLHEKIALALLEISGPKISEKAEIERTADEINLKQGQRIEGIPVEGISVEETKITDETLKENVLIKIINPNQEFSYRYSSNGWVTNDETFIKNKGYVEGINEILYRLDPNGKIYVNNKLVQNDFNSVVNELRK